MKLEGQITVLIKREGTTIEVKDKDSNITFLEITLTPEQLSAALSRQAYVECELDVRGIEKVGKKHECKTFEFEITDEFTNRRKRDELKEIAQSQLTDGWVADGYFSSQNSFFTKDGKQFARCTIRRWV